MIFWGSLGAAYTERVAARWTPGAIGDPDRFRCSVYHAQLGALLANQDSAFTSVKSLIRDPPGTLRPLGNPEHVFVRPDSALKPFSGRQLAVSALTLEALDHGYYYEDEDLPIVVSSAKVVGHEWRFVLADGVIVAGCAYGPDRSGAGTDLPQGARALAEEVASADWKPAPIYILDVALVYGSFRVMELNPFSGADLYDCDPSAVVSAATRVAKRLYREANPSW